MDFTRYESTDYLWATLENAIATAGSLRTKHSTSTLSNEVLPVSELSDFEAFKEKIILWQEETESNLRSMFKDQAVTAFYCPPIQDVDLINASRLDEITHLKASLAERVESLKSLISQVRQAEGL